jgi:GNAT superfamily N-acetyltransferase
VSGGRKLQASRAASPKKASWLKLAPYRPLIRTGHQVKMGKDRLRAQYLPKDAICSYVRVTVDGHLAGNAFACRWKYNNRTVCWITQLVVHRDYRERGLAVGLLNELKDNDDIYGLVSSHPAACVAAARVFGSKRFLRSDCDGSTDSSQALSTLFGLTL